MHLHTKFEIPTSNDIRDMLRTRLFKLEDLKALRRSPDLFNNVKIGQGQLPLILIKQILFYHIWGLQPFTSSDLNNLMNTPSNSPVISEKPMFRYECGSPNEWH